MTFSSSVKNWQRHGLLIVIVLFALTSPHSEVGLSNQDYMQNQFLGNFLIDLLDNILSNPQDNQPPTQAPSSQTQTSSPLFGDYRDSDDDQILAAFDEGLTHLPEDIGESLLIAGFDVNGNQIGGDGPGGGNPESGGKCKSITMRKITWTFKDEVTCGQFVTGEWWVLGPVEVVAINPPSRNRGGGWISDGSMINPQISLNNKHGYDSKSRDTGYDSTLNVGMGISSINPLRLTAGTSLISSKSLPLDAPSNRRPYLEAHEVLTVLGSVPPIDAFRPPAIGTDKSKIFTLSQIGNKRSLHQNLDCPTTNMYSATRLIDKVIRPHIEHGLNWWGAHYRARDNQYYYGRERAADMGDTALAVHCKQYTTTEKEQMMVGMIQFGIDMYYGNLKTFEKQRGKAAFQTRDSPWGAAGGHSQGSKWPILYAGIMLNDDNMKNVGTDYPYAFQEDQQTFYVDQQVIKESEKDLCYTSWKWEKTPSGQLICSNKVWGPLRPPACWFPDCRASTRAIMDQNRYTTAMLGMPDWGIHHRSHPHESGPLWNFPYRNCCTANSHAGFVLAILAMDARDLWAHDAFFDYQDRYMDIRAPGSLRAWSRWQEHSWNKLRNELGKRYTGQASGGTCTIGTLGAGNRCYIDDSSCQNGLKRPCGSDVGACVAGTQTCTNNKWGACVGSIGPTTEICDGLDNDCDGQTDENLVGQLCPKQNGVCAGSREICGGASGWQRCDDTLYRSHNSNYENPERTCDLLDNDCDGGVNTVNGNNICTETCSQKQGTICTGAQVCTGTLTGSKDGICCVGGICRDPLKSLVHHWQFDETTGNTFKDSTGSLDATCSGSSCPTSVAGKVGLARQFDGTNDEARIATNTIGTLSKVTVTAWVKLNAGADSGGSRVIMNSRTNTGGDHWGFNLRRNEGFSFYVKGSGEVKDSTVPKTGQWYFLAGTYDGTSVKTYVDSVLKASTTHSTTTIGDNNKPITFGAHAESPDSRRLTGVIDDVRIFSEALSQSDIRAVMNDVGGGGPTNKPPQVNAGPDQTITLPQVATLDATVTDDGLPNPPGTTTVTWSKHSGPGTVTFTNNKAVDTTATFSTKGTYTLRLTATDSLLQASDTITITVNDKPQPNAPPKLNPIGNKQIAQFEKFSFIVNATDPNNDPLTYTATNLPQGSTLQNQQFIWTPTTINTYPGITFTVTDNGQPPLSDSETITIEVLSPKDDDNDGVPNFRDRCKKTPPNHKVNIFGCSRPLHNFSKHLTTNFTKADLLNVTNLTLGKDGIGGIVFLGHKIPLLKKGPLRYHRVNLNKIIIEKNKIAINTSNQNLSVFNKSAILVFYNVDLNNPQILVDQNPCSACSVISFSDRVLIVSVPHFSEYTIEEGFFCGDNSCNGAETCSTCEKDCGQCKNNNNQGSGSGGSGGSRGGTTFICKTGEKRQCGSSVGQCTFGTQTCSNNKWGACTGGTQPTKEICDGKDNNCNAVIDEGNTCLECKPGETKSCGSPIGICTEGKQACKNGVWSDCQGNTPPEPKDICGNNLDDNCNGETDETCEAPEHCTNSIQDNDELGVDCGGSCPHACFIHVDYSYTIFYALFIVIGALLVAGYLYVRE